MAEELQRVAILPIGVGQLEKIAALGGAGIVDEDVERTELALDVFDQLSGRVLLAQVADRTAARRPSLRIAAAASSSAA